MENPFNTEETKPKRSTLLTVLLVLTFIGSGISLVGNAYLSLFLDQYVELIEDAVDDDALASLSSLFDNLIETLEKVGSGYFGLLALLALASVAGAVLMWKLNKLGFHFYASAQVLLLLIPMVFGVTKFPGVFETALTALFIWFYARELKIFK
ncbi:MAG: hypothetical protein LBP96_06375 [Bacteroidales bacterium]|jgi:ABC-type multidrug transport system fused ATPase/permease subunit|nr:hypothetical protein [Bacteroidales bacterium]